VLTIYVGSTQSIPKDGRGEEVPDDPFPIFPKPFYFYEALQKACGKSVRNTT